MPLASAGTASVHGQESSAINARKLVRLAGVVLLALAIAVPLAAQQGNLDELNARVIELYRARKFLEAVPVAEEAIRVAEATFGKDHPKLATAVNNLAVLYDSQGEYVKAEPLYKQALEIRQKALGENDPAVATTLNDLATMYTDQGRFAEAEGMLQRALAIREKAYGPEHSSVATSLNDLAVLYKSEGKYADAEPLLRRALAIWEKTLGPDHPDLATSLNNLAVLYDTQGKYVEAEPLYKRALAIREKALGPEHPSVANTLNDLATMYVDQARYADAEPMLRRALAIREKALGADSGPVAISLNDLAMLYKSEGKYADAQPLLERALAIRRRILSPDSPELATSLNNLAAVYNAQGKFDEAEPLFLRALEIREKTLGPNDPRFATQLSNMAEMYRDRGKYIEAEPRFLHVLNIREKVLGPEHPDVVSSLNNLAAVYTAEGRYAEAIPLLQRVIAILEKTLGAKHPSIANSLIDLARLYREQGKYAEAEAFYKRALAIREEALGSDSPALVIPLNTLGELYRLQGHYSEAEQRFQRALDIGTKRLGQEHPSVATSLNSLAETYLAQGKLADAEPLLQRALAIRIKALGPDHAETGTTLENLGLAYYGLKQPREAEGYFDRRLQNLAKQFDEHFAHMSEKERLEFFDRVATAFPVYFSFCFTNWEQNPALVGKMYDVLLWEKGLVARTIGAMRERIAASGDKKAMDLLEKLTAKRAELAALSGAQPADREQWSKTLERLNEEANYLERELAERSGALGEQKVLARFTWREVQGQLKPDEAAIEYIRFRFHDGRKWTDTYEYAALVARPGSATAPTLVALGKASQLEGTPFEEYRKRTSTKAGSAPASGPGLYQAFWKPLETALAGVRRIYLSPDGILDQVSLAVVADESGRLLLEKYDLRTVSSTQDLLREKHKPARDLAVLIGNPDFDLGASQKEAPAPPEEQGDKSGRAISTTPTVRHSREQRILPLPATQAEVNALASLLQGHHWTVRVYAREKALKETLKRVKNPRVLHVATQSFNLPLPKEKSSAGATDRPAVLEDPMLRSGLYFAGANRTLSGGIVGAGVDDGILTAYEATELDLHGTELVVLSASESGLGQAMSGEGVFGLRRALLEAGAEAVLVSMWNVPDKETQELMTLFYQKWLAGRDKHEALREAQLEMRSRVKARYGGDRPALWGAFVLLGR